MCRFRFQFHLKLFLLQEAVIGKVSSSMMGSVGAILEIVLILYPLEDNEISAVLNGRFGNTGTWACAPRNRT